MLLSTTPVVTLGSSGNGATALVADVFPGPNSSFPSNFTVSGTNLFFLAIDPTQHVDKLWVTNGTAGAQLLASNVEASAPVAVGSTVYFTGFDLTTHNFAVYSTNGTQAGTQLVAPLPTSSTTASVALGNLAFFQINDTSKGSPGVPELWETNGTAQGTAMVATLPSNLSNLTVSGGKLFFSDFDAAHGTELWTSDGTAAGTHLLSDINPGTANSFPQHLTDVGGTLYFIANDGTKFNGLAFNQLWTSDGTPAGTHKVSPSLQPAQLASLNGQLIFNGSDHTLAGSHPGLWTYATGQAAPQQILTLPAGFQGDLASGGGVAYFGFTPNSSATTQLWKSAGTSATTALITSVADEMSMAVSGGRLYFTNDNLTNDTELWASDGTAAGTQQVTNINPTSSANPGNLTDFNGTLFFDATDTAHGDEVWKTGGQSGTPLPTTLNETDTLSGKGSFSDQAADGPWTATVDYGDGAGPVALALNADNTFNLNHQYLEEGAFTITVSVTNAGNLTGSASARLTVNSVAPVAAITGAPATSPEGAPIALGSLVTIGQSGIVEDDASETWSVTQNGQPFASDTGASFTFTPNDDGTYVVSLSALNDDGQSSPTVSKSINVTNVGPSNVSVSPSSATLTEGDTLSVNLSFTDPGALDTHTVLVSWGDGTSTNVTLGAGVSTLSGLSHQYLDVSAKQPGGTFPIQATVTDSEGTSSSGSSSVQVNDAVPSSIALSVSGSLNADGSLNEGGSVTLSGSFTDPGTADTHLVTVTWGDGSSDTVALPAGTQSFTSPAHTYADNQSGDAPYTISVSVADEDGATGAAATQLVVHNVAPSNVVATTSSTGINEDDSLSLNVAFSDPGTLDTHTVSVDWGDGSTATQVNLAAGVNTLNGLTHQYVASSASQAGGHFAVAVTVTDKDGAVGQGTSTVQVNDPPPANIAFSFAGNLNNDGSLNEGGSVAVSGSFSNPVSDDMNTATVDWGDGSQDMFTLTAGSQTFQSPNHTYSNNLPGNAAYQVTVTVSDEEGASGSSAQPFVVKNVAPSALAVAISSPLNSDGSINEGSSTALSGTFSDPGTADSHTVTIQWGDGGQDTLDLGPGVLSFNTPAHLYADNQPGDAPYAITVTVADSDGASTGAGLPLVVHNVAPANLAIVATTQTPEGSTVNLTGSFTDPGLLDTHTVSVAWGDGQVDTLNLSVGVFSFGPLSHLYQSVPPGNAPFTINVTVTDKDGASVQTSQSVVTSEIPPTVAIVGTPQSSPEGTPIQLSAAISDPDPITSITGYTVSWTVTKNGVLFASGQGLNFSFAPDDNGSYALSLAVSDNDGGNASANATISVTNVAPAASISGDADGVRGQPRSFNISATDPSSADTKAGFVYRVNWGAGSVVQVVNPGSSPALTHIFTANGQYTVQVTATDKDGATSAVVSQSITINAVEIETDPIDATKTDLVVGGTTGDDTIRITPNPDTSGIRVKINGTVLGSFSPTGRIVIYGQSGNDSIVVSSSIHLTTVIYTGNGNNTVVGGGGDSILVGGSGNNTLIGKKGNNLIIGGSGKSVLVGNGNSLLIAGSTAYDHNDLALMAILQEWSSDDALSDRVTHLQHGITFKGQTIKLTSATITPRSGDVVVGVGKANWFVVNHNDLLVQEGKKHSVVTYL
jgi:ELWxxDGT repeat protein